MCDILLKNGPMPSARLRIGAFFTALLVAPIVGSLAVFFLAPFGEVFYEHSSVFAFAALIAPFVGTKTYLLFGTPIFLCLVLMCHGGVILGAISGALAMWIASHSLEPGIMIDAGWVFAPIWGATFGFTYRTLVLSGT